MAKNKKSVQKYYRDLKKVVRFWKKSGLEILDDSEVTQLDVEEGMRGIRELEKHKYGKKKYK
ncbi:hypothetical protein CL633_04485 [bacterium]|nr:hypothetical protein [bacterium]